MNAMDRKFYSDRILELRKDLDALRTDLAKVVDKNAEWEKRCYAAEAERDSYRQEWAAAMDWVNVLKKELAVPHVCKCGGKCKGDGNV